MTGNEPKSHRVPLEGLVSHLSTPDEVERFAFYGNHAILSQCVQMYRNGKYTWEQAMQVAAFSQAESLAIMNKECMRLMERVPAIGVMANAALTGAPETKEK